jgi:hypothetical protein
MLLRSRPVSSLSLPGLRISACELVIRTPWVWSRYLEVPPDVMTGGVEVGVGGLVVGVVVGALVGGVVAGAAVAPEPDPPSAGAVAGGVWVVVVGT